MDIGIIGLGLIGASIAKSIKKNSNEFNIVAFDIDEKILKQALYDKVIDDYTLNIDEKFNNCDIIFISTPVPFVKDYVLKLSKVIKEDCLLTDVCSTKQTILEEISNIENINFIGGHPMAGSEKSGYFGSSEILFENAFYVVTPYENTKKKYIDRLKNIIELIKAIYIELPSDIHDKSVAIISHIPHIIASCMVNYVKQNDDDNKTLKTLSAGGFKDITRIASSDGALWQSIILSNKEYIIENLQGLIKEIETIILNINDESSYIKNYINNGKIYRDSFKNTNSFQKLYKINVIVEDEPNVIGLVATILGNQNVNIKNIGIINNREDEEGALEIHFESDNQKNLAIEVLQENGYKIANI